MAGDPSFYRSRAVSPDAGKILSRWKNAEAGKSFQSNKTGNCGVISS
jgi:hypothetical protein